jgi:hypothetical protein
MFHILFVAGIAHLLVPFDEEAAPLRKYRFEYLLLISSINRSVAPTCFVFPIQSPFFRSPQDVDTYHPLPTLPHFEVLR